MDNFATQSPPFGGQGVMSVTNASQVVNAANVTKAPNSLTFPAAATVLPLGVMRIKLQPGASTTVSICWQGGTATATNGEILAAGESRLVALPIFATNPPTLIATTAATVAVEVEW